MKYCNYCKVNIHQDKEKCVLCGNFLSAVTEDESEDIFPEVAPSFERHLWLKIMLFISICTIVISFVIDMIFPSTINWPLLLVFGLASIWLGLVVIFQKRYNIHKKIIWQVVIVSLLSLFWDWNTGWQAWSISYLMPTIFISAMVIMYVTAKIMKLSIRNYIIYALIDGVLGILPALFLLFGWVTTRYPSIISVGVSIIFLSAIFIFKGKEIREELNRKMHI